MTSFSRWRSASALRVVLVARRQVLERGEDAGSSISPSLLVAELVRAARRLRWREDPHVRCAARSAAWSRSSARRTRRPGRQAGARRSPARCRTGRRGSAAAPCSRARASAAASRCRRTSAYARARAVLEHVVPPAVRRPGDAHVVGHHVEHLAHAVGVQRVHEAPEVVPRSPTSGLSAVVGDVVAVQCCRRTACRYGEA